MVTPSGIEIAFFPIRDITNDCRFQCLSPVAFLGSDAV